MELEHMNHHGTFPEKQEQAGRGWAIAGAGQKLAEIRNRSNRKQARIAKREAERAAQDPDHDNVHYGLEPNMDLEGARIDIIGMFC